MTMETQLYKSSKYGPVGSAASLQCQDTGLMPGPAQWVKDLALLQLQHRSYCSSDVIPGLGTPYAMGQPKKKRRKEKKGDKSATLQNP